jgi:mannan endo-1,4-beta-mannosidase
MANRSLGIVAVALIAVAIGSCADSAPSQGPVATDAGGSAADTGAPPSADAGTDTGTASTDVPQPGVDSDAGNPTADVSPAVDISAERGAPPLMGLVKIMVIGSSNETDTCWRAFLWQKLRAAGVMNFDLVGRVKVGPDCGVPGYDKDVEAQAGTIFTSFSANDFAVRFKANPPQIVLVHVAGADARNGVPIPTIMKAFSLAVEQARAVNPQVIFFVAQHTPQEPPTGIAEMNAAIPVWAAQISTTDSPVSAVDLFSIINPAADQSDRVHLNISGSQKVADAWLAKLLPLLK